MLVKVNIIISLLALENDKIPLSQFTVVNDTSNAAIDKHSEYETEISEPITLM